MNGKKRRVKQLDLRTAMKAAGIPEKVIDNLLTKYRSQITAWIDLIDHSFLSDPMKEEYRALILSKAT